MMMSKEETPLFNPSNLIQNLLKIDTTYGCKCGLGKTCGKCWFYLEREQTMG